MKKALVALGLTLALPSAWGVDYECKQLANPVTLDNPFIMPGGINKAAKVAGFFIDAGNLSHGFVYDGQTKAYQANLDAPGAENGTVATGINDNGLIVGYYTDFMLTVHGFAYDGLAYKILDMPNSSATYPQGLNKLGVVVGDYRKADGSIHGFIYNGTGFTSFDAAVGAFSTTLTDINDRGELAGYFQATPTASERGFFKYGSTPKAGDYTLDANNGVSMSSAAVGLNNDRQLVGDYRDKQGGFHSFVGTSLAPLDSICGFAVYDLDGISSNGDLVGRYFDAQGGLHAFIANPLFKRKKSAWKRALFNSAF